MNAPHDLHPVTRVVWTLAVLFVFAVGFPVLLWLASR